MGVQNFELKYIFFWGGGGGVQKKDIFGGMKILWIFFVVGASQNWTSFRGYLELFILGSFLKMNIQNRDIFGGCKDIKYFFGVLDIPDIFWGKQLMLDPSLRMKKKR